MEMRPSVTKSTNAYGTHISDESFVSLPSKYPSVNLLIFSLKTQKLLICFVKRMELLVRERRIGADPRPPPVPFPMY